MDIKLKIKFMEFWQNYFPNCEMPIAWFYSDNLIDVKYPDPPKSKGYTCIFSQLAPVRMGRSRAFNQKNLGCAGAFRPFGFNPELTYEAKEYMCHVERIKKSFKHLESMVENRKTEPVKEKYILFKRWDTLQSYDDPKAVFFFCTPDMISGLHGLANFDSMNPNTTISPFATGCDSIVGIPMEECESKDPKVVIGALDPSVRNRLKSNVLTFSIPWLKWLSMMDNIGDCFLTTENWITITSRFK